MIAITPPVSVRELNRYTIWMTRRKIEYRILEHDEFLQKDDVLMLCGGSDFGTNKERDRRELELLHQAFEWHIPIVGICRGMQVCNIAMGGTVKDLNETGCKTHQEVAATIGDSATDKMKQSKFHEVHIIKSWGRDSNQRLGSRITVNSRHHQMIDLLAPNLQLDGYCVGDDVPEIALNNSIRLVQWHPEFDEVYDSDCEIYVSNWIKEKIKEQNDRS